MTLEPAVGGALLAAIPNLPVPQQGPSRGPVLKPNREVRPFQDVLIDLAGRLGLPNLPHFAMADVRKVLGALLTMISVTIAISGNLTRSRWRNRRNK